MKGSVGGGCHPREAFGGSTKPVEPRCGALVGLDGGQWRRIPAAMLSGACDEVTVEERNRRAKEQAYGN